MTTIDKKMRQNPLERSARQLLLIRKSCDKKINASLGGATLKRNLTAKPYEDKIF